MLQRAASNAYSWWWASHIRTKQGKWLQQNLDDMEEKVKNILILIEEDADSFARRAEMYYKKRPELISFVEESYRAYRALAERYEHISGELQNANNTIATVFPEQVPISIEEDDDVNNQEKVSTVDPSKVPKTPENPKFKFPIIDAKKRRSSKPKKPQPKKPSSNMTKDEAQEEIDKLQKGILVLQTEKEFVMSSYESGLAKFWDIEQQIEEMQEKVCELQDEFSVSKDIEDNEARALMTASALKSCEDTLVQLQEQQKRSTAEARVEAERVKDAEEKLKAFKDGFLQNHTDDRKLPEEANIADSVNKNLVEEVCNLKEERLELQLICEKLREYFDINSDSSLTVTELAEKVDELVNKVLSLENAVSSQTALIKRLRLETDELQNHLQSLEEDRESLLDDSKSLNDKIRELEEELNRIQDLNRSVKDESSKLQMHFTEACHNLDNLSEELQSPNQQDKVEITGLPQLEESDLHDLGPCKQIEKEEDIKMRVNGLINLKDEIIEQGEIQGTRENHVRSENLLDLKHLHDVGPFKQIEEEEDITMRVDGPINLKDEIIEQGETQGTQENHVRSENLLDLKQQDEVENKDASQEEDDVLNVGGDSPNWGQLFLNGLEDREKILLAEYTSILRNYKEIKRRLSEVENKSQESLFETTAQIRELKNDNAIKDAEIQSLRQRVSMLQTSLHEKKETRVLKSKDLMQNRAESTIDQWKSLFSDLHVKSPGQSKLRRLEDLLKEQSINSPSRTDESNAFTSKEHPHSEEEIKESLVNKQHTASTIEGKFRRDIDGLLEENLDFWSRFSTSFDQIQKFQKAVQDLQAKFTKLKNDDKKHESSANAADQTLKSEATSIEKHLRELQTELSAWLERSASLKDELQCRLSSICKIQEEISRVSKMHSKTEKSEFTEQQAARFQGEVLDMQQENNKVASELQAGLDHVRKLQFEIQKNLSNLHENFELSGSKSNRQQANARNAFSRAKIPLRYFIFGTKPKPKKPSLFSCINPALQKQYSDLRAAGAEPPM